MKFSTLNLKAKYDSDEDDILQCFYIPLMSNANRYDRAVGYFSADVLASAGAGLKTFILSKGKIRLIVGDPLSDSEYEAVMHGLSNPAKKRSEELSQLLLTTEDSKLKLLTYLVANKQLEIKFAFTHEGMFHKKIGIFYQTEETVVFSGSANETLAGLSKYNSEEISVFFNWKTSFDDYGQIEIDNFNALWDNNKKRTKVIELDSDAYQKIQQGTDLAQLRKELLNQVKPLPPDLAPKPFFRYSFPKSSQELVPVTIAPKLPHRPLMVKEQPFELFPHQIQAINCWKNASHQGLFKLATGAGKTITSMAAMVELYEQRIKNQEPTFVIISVPYIELANQWVDELSLFNVYPIKCYENSAAWSSALDTKTLRFRNKGLNFVCLVVVNKTLSSEKFQSKISKIPLDQMLFIGDECHHLGSENLFNALPDCKFRIGLSATPFRSDDDELEGSPFKDEHKQNLISYFRGIVSEYSLSDAIHDGILSPYRYDIVPVYLDDEEQELFEELSTKIQKLILKSQTAGLAADEKQILTSLCGKRSRLLATCKGKLPALIGYLNQHPKLSLSHSLIYVGEGCANNESSPYINKVTNKLDEHGHRVAKFTAAETSNERKRIMKNFKDEDIECLVAMKVLDEGIDVPICRNAFILASTRNPRQYVQRRGRVLRKAKGKEEALIVDFVVLPNFGSLNQASQNLRKAELNRINDFKLTALNPREVEKRTDALGIW